MPHRTATFVALVCVLVLAPAVRAQRGQQQPPPAPTSPMASILSLQCTYTTYADALWTGGAVKVEIKPQTFTFQIAAIDAKRGSARIVGNAGAAEATSVLTPTGLTILERTPLGNFNVTTVFTGGAQAGKYISVHSRHIGSLDATPEVTQNYGTCEVPETGK
jgi:hypothetical protein